MFLIFCFCEFLLSTDRPPLGQARDPANVVTVRADTLPGSVTFSDVSDFSDVDEDNKLILAGMGCVTIVVMVAMLCYAHGTSPQERLAKYMELHRQLFFKHFTPGFFQIMYILRSFFLGMPVPDTAPASFQNTSANSTAFFDPIAASHLSMVRHGSFHELSVTSLETLSGNWPQLSEALKAAILAPSSSTTCSAAVVMARNLLRGILANVRSSYVTCFYILMGSVLSGNCNSSATLPPAPQFLDVCTLGSPPLGGNPVPPGAIMAHLYPPFVTMEVQPPLASTTLPAVMPGSTTFPATTPAATPDSSTAPAATSPGSTSSAPESTKLPTTPGSTAGPTTTLTTTPAPTLPGSTSAAPGSNTFQATTTPSSSSAVPGSTALIPGSTKDSSTALTTPASTLAGSTTTPAPTLPGSTFTAPGSTTSPSATPVSTTTTFPPPTTTALTLQNASRLYWANFGNSRIYYANISGPTLTNPMLLFQGNGTTLTKPSGIFLDLRTSRLYMGDYNGAGLFVGDCTTYSTALENVRKLQGGQVYGLSLNTTSQRIGFSGWAIPLSIGYITPGTLVPRNVTTLSSLNTRAIAFDEPNAYVYWTDWSTQYLWAASFNPQNPTTINGSRQLTTTPMASFFFDFETSTIYWRTTGASASIYRGLINRTLPTAPTNTTLVLTDTSNLMGNEGGIFVL